MSSLAQYVKENFDYLTPEEKNEIANKVSVAIASMHDTIQSNFPKCVWMHREDKDVLCIYKDLKTAYGDLPTLCKLSNWSDKEKMFCYVIGDNGHLISLKPILLI